MAILLSKEAASKLSELLAVSEYGEKGAVRFGVKGGGCSGFTMEVSLEPARKFDMPRIFDTKCVSDNIRILVDRKSNLFLDGLTVNYVQTQFGHKFTYDNPNVSGWCGCGESFAV